MTRSVPEATRNRLGTGDTYYRIVELCPLHAATPDLLGGGRDLLSILRDLRDAAYAEKWGDVHGILFGDVATEAIEREEAAIAKAEGRTCEWEAEVLSTESVLLTRPRLKTMRRDPEGQP